MTSSKPLGFLIQVDDEDSPTETYILYKYKTRIGRKEKDNDVVIDNETISSRHCEIGMMGTCIIHLGCPLV